MPFSIDQYGDESMRKEGYRNAAVAAVCAVAFGVASYTVPALAFDSKSWLRKVAVTVAEKQVYPRSAVSRQIEGRAKVRVSVARDGSIANYEFVQETGHTVLDREVDRLMKRIDPLPSPPSDMADDDLTFVIPLTWRLN